MSSQGSRNNNGTLLGWEFTRNQYDGIWSSGWSLKIKTLFFTFTIDNHGWFDIRRVYKPTKYSGGVDWSFWGKTVSIDLNEDYERGQTYYGGDAGADGYFGWDNRKAIWAEQDAQRKLDREMRDSHLWSTTGGAHDYDNGYCLRCLGGSGMRVFEMCPGTRTMTDVENKIAELEASDSWVDHTNARYLKAVLEIVRRGNDSQ